MAALLNLNVLLADDDENDLILFRRLFKQLDCVGRFAVVPTGEQVLAYLQGQGQYSDRSSWPFPGVLVLDRCMPRLSGIDVLCWIRTEPRFSKLPVVLLSAGMPPSEAAMLTGLHAAYCPKSISLKDCARSLEEAIVTALSLVRDPCIRDTDELLICPSLLPAHESAACLSFDL